MSDCEHKWVFLETKRRRNEGAYQANWILTERFFCEKCLEQQTVTKDEWSRDPPEWW